MSSLLNSIFFIKKEHLNINNVLNVLQSFMFTKITQVAVLFRSNLKIKDSASTESMIEKSPIEVLTKEEVKIENKIIEEPIIVAKEELISPKQNDTLFWCLFIIHFGYGEYQEVSRNYGVKELEVKKHIGEVISKNAHEMKTTSLKITKAGVQEILSELLTSQKETSINTMMAILVCFKFNLIMVNSTRLLMLEFIANKDNELPTYVVYKDTYGKYSVKMESLSIDEIQVMKDKMIHLESYLKPLKSISNYKVDELEILAKKMGIYEEGKKYKKTDLYQEISEACTWL
jgi:hypothetical protein